MIKKVDLSNPRYYNEFMWIKRWLTDQEIKYGCNYENFRIESTKSMKDDTLRWIGINEEFFYDKTIIDIGCGCTGHIAAFKAKLKIGIDPLLHIYQQNNLLLKDLKDTLLLSMDGEDLPILDNFVDFVMCINALDHMINPSKAVKEIRRILKPAGLFYLDVDLGGESEPDEPTVFSEHSLKSLFKDKFKLVKEEFIKRLFNEKRNARIRILLKKTL